VDGVDGAVAHDGVAASTRHSRAAGILTALVGHLFVPVCIWTMSWFTNPVGFAAYRLLPGGGWVGDRSA